MYHEFVLTSRPYIRTVTEVKPEWYASAVCSIGLTALADMDQSGCCNMRQTTTTCRAVAFRRERLNAFLRKLWRKAEVGMQNKMIVVERTVAHAVEIFLGSHSTNPIKRIIAPVVLLLPDQSQFKKE